MLPLMGLGIGVTQIVRGAINTPEAVRQKMRGKVWDNVRLSAATLGSYTTGLRFLIPKHLGPR